MNQNDLELQPAEVYRIPLTRGQFSLVDREDFERLSGFKWYAMWCSHSKSFRVARKEDGKTIYMHREVTCAGPGTEVDHKFGDTLDNRKSQLRVVDRQRNSINRRMNENSTSGFRGVTWVPSRGKWMAFVKSGGKHKHVGYYDSAEAARDARVPIALELHGEFIRQTL